MKVRLNLATKPLVLHRRFYVATGATGAVAVIALFLLSWHVYAVRKADASLRIQREAAFKSMDQLKTDRQELERFFSQPENAKLHERAEFVTSILDARSFNWTRMFMDFERVVPTGVRIMSIKPKQTNGQAEVKITVGAVSEEAKQKFMDALQQTDAFSHLQLVSVRPAGHESVSDSFILELTLLYSRA